MTRLQTWFDWLCAKGRRRAAREQIAGRSVWQDLSLARARSCLRLAEYAVQLGTGDTAFASEGLALLRWSCLWALAYEADGPRAPEALLGGSPADSVVAAAGDRERWEGLRTILGRGPFEDASLPVAQVDADRRALRSFATALIVFLERPERELARAHGDAAVRIAAALVGAAAIGFLAFHERLGPDLAEGRPWKASSKEATCDPVRASCAGKVTAVFFHTKEEESPWVEIDLGGDSKPFARIDVRNRTDCCQDRAVPLVVEVGDDEARWTEVAWRHEPFLHWTARFSPVRARYVRLRVPRKTFLHLESIEIR